MTAARAINRWTTGPLCDPAKHPVALWDRPSSAALLEFLRADAELPSIGRARFAGSLKQRNDLWLDYRNYLRQALANFRAALGVDNRSASLLLYYAMLNFAKAELLSVHPNAVRGFVTHGLTFHPARAKSVAGDTLTVTDGIFRMLYEHRTGYPLRVGTKLSVRRLLARIPEIGDQLHRIGLGPTMVAGVLHLTAADATSAWTLLAVEDRPGAAMGAATARLLSRVFQRVDPPSDWRDKFGMSRRWGDPVTFYESRATFPHDGFDSPTFTAAFAAAQRDAWTARDILEPPTSGGFDAWLTPSLYSNRLFPMPPSIARYALSYYASSLVRYRPSMFDTQVAPEFAYLFDALARETALPMLSDASVALTGELRVFIGEDGFRV